MIKFNIIKFIEGHWFATKCCSSTKIFYIYVYIRPGQETRQGSLVNSTTETDKLPISDIGDTMVNLFFVFFCRRINTYLINGLISHNGVCTASPAKVNGSWTWVRKQNPLTPPWTSYYSQKDFLPFEPLANRYTFLVVNWNYLFYSLFHWSTIGRLVLYMNIEN